MHDEFWHDSFRSSRCYKVWEFCICESKDQRKPTWLEKNRHCVIRNMRSLSTWLGARKVDVRLLFSRFFWIPVFLRVSRDFSFVSLKIYIQSTFVKKLQPELMARNCEKTENAHRKNIHTRDSLSCGCFTIFSRRADITAIVMTHLVAVLPTGVFWNLMRKPSWCFF